MRILLLAGSAFFMQFCKTQNLSRKQSERQQQRRNNQARVRTAKAERTMIAVTISLEKSRGNLDELQPRQMMHAKTIKNTIAKMPNPIGFRLTFKQKEAQLQVQLAQKSKFILSLQIQHSTPQLSTFSCSFLLFWCSWLQTHFLKHLSWMYLTLPVHLQRLRSQLSQVLVFQRQMRHSLAQGWMVVDETGTEKD